MEPELKAPSNMNLPPVAVEGYDAALPAEQVSSSPETYPGRTETSTAASNARVVPTLTPTGPQTASGTSQMQNDDVATTTNMPAPALADDSDLIEKEWVSKAKEIVAQTRDNPHQQSRAISGLRADYLQKRYQKTVKLSE